MCGFIQAEVGEGDVARVASVVDKNWVCMYSLTPRCYGHVHGVVPEQCCMYCKHNQKKILFQLVRFTSRLWCPRWRVQSPCTYCPGGQICWRGLCCACIRSRGLYFGPKTIFIPPPFWKWYFSPSCNTSFFYSHCGLLP